MVLDKKFYWLSEQYAHDVYPLNLDNHKSHYSWVYVFYNRNTELCSIGSCMSLEKTLELYRKKYDIIVVTAICLGETDEAPHFVANYLANYFADRKIKELDNLNVEQFNQTDVVGWYNLNIRDIVQIRRLFWETIEGDHIVGLEI